MYYYGRGQCALTWIFIYASKFQDGKSQERLQERNVVGKSLEI